MNFRQWRQLRIESIGVAILGVVGLFTFQNCNATASGGLNSLGSGTVNTLLSSQPIPVEFNLNEISYMSCPLAGATPTGTTGDALSNPFYRVRFGSFDNSAANGFIDPTLSGHPVDNVGGLGFTQNSMNYMRSINKNPAASMLSNYLTTSPYTSTAQPVVAMINQYRSTYSLAWNALATSLLVPLSNTNLISSLTTATQIAGSGTTPQGFFPTLTNGQNSILGSILWGTQIVDETNFRTNLMNQYLFAGFAPSANTDTPSDMIQNLESPDGTPTERLFGYGYSFVFNYNDPSVSNIYEWDLDPASGGNPTNLTAQNGQLWDCFALTVVRDIDRKYWTVSSALSTQSTFLNKLMGTTNGVTFSAGNVLHPLDVNTIGQSNPSLQTNYIRDGAIAVPSPYTTNDIPYLMVNMGLSYTYAAQILATYNSIAQPLENVIPNYNSNVNLAALSGQSLCLGTITAGVCSVPLVTYPLDTINLQMGSNGYDGGTYHPCPPEDPLVLAADPVKMERLRVIRRFLPANLWEVNVTDMCAVPTSSALSIGSCYASPGSGATATSMDTDMTQYVQYNGVQGTTCGGTSMTACPAKVSFCWRYH